MTTQRLIEQLTIGLLELVKNGRTIAALRATGVTVDIPTATAREPTAADQTRIRKAKGLTAPLIWQLIERDGLCLELGLTREQVDAACTASTPLPAKVPKPTAPPAAAAPETAPAEGRSSTRRLKHPKREITEADRQAIRTARAAVSEKEWQKTKRDQVCKALGLTRKQLAGVRDGNAHAHVNGSVNGNETPATTHNGFDLSPWPPRSPKRGSNRQPPKSQEYPVDKVDHDIVIAARRAINAGTADESQWGTIKYEIAAHRRITLKQIDGITSTAARSHLIPPIGN